MGPPAVAGLAQRRRVEEPEWSFAARKHRDGILPVDGNGARKSFAAAMARALMAGR